MSWSIAEDMIKKSPKWQAFTRNKNLFLQRVQDQFGIGGEHEITDYGDLPSIADLNLSELITDDQDEDFDLEQVAAH